MATTTIKKIGTLPIEILTPARMKMVKKEIMMIVGNESANHFLEGFRQGGGQGGGQTDDSKDGWQRRNPGARANSTRSILVDEGHLRRDIRVQTVTESQVIIGTRRIPYAVKHNEGLEGLPKREFIGPSRDLQQKNAKTIGDELDKVLKAKK